MSRIRKLTLEQTIMDQAAKQIANDIDREILWELLEDAGWSRVSVSRFVDNKHAVDISEWLKANCQNDYERDSRDFLFESESDAVLFTLRWK